MQISGHRNSAATLFEPVEKRTQQAATANKSRDTSAGLEISRPGELQGVKRIGAASVVQRSGNRQSPRAPRH